MSISIQRQFLAAAWGRSQGNPEMSELSLSINSSQGFQLSFTGSLHRRLLIEGLVKEDILEKSWKYAGRIEFNITKGDNLCDLKKKDKDCKDCNVTSVSFFDPLYALRYGKHPFNLAAFLTVHAKKNLFRLWLHSDISQFSTLLFISCRLYLSQVARLSYWPASRNIFGFFYINRIDLWRKAYCF